MSFLPTPYIDNSTPEQRSQTYQIFEQPDKGQISCPVCFKLLKSNYALDNHFRNRKKGVGLVFKDEGHKEYWLKARILSKEEHKVKLESTIYSHVCVRCNKKFEVDYFHRFKKRCPECSTTYPTRVKKPTNRTRTSLCPRCGSPQTTNSHSTNRVCDQCRKKERELEVARILSTPIIVPCMSCHAPVTYFKRHIRDRVSHIWCEKCKSDAQWFMKDPDYNKVIELLKTTSLTRKEIKDTLHLDRDYVREAAIDFFGSKWYAKRVKEIKNRGLLQAQFSRPSGLEKAFSNKLSMDFL